MSRGVNKVILIGNLGKDPEVISFDGGVKKASFSLATSEVYRTRDGQDMEQTEWHNIVLWRGLAEVAEKYLRKGSQIYVEGRIKSRSYEKDGQKRFITEIECDNLTMLGNKNSSDFSSSNERSTSGSPAPAVPAPEDDLPF
jgi:single-strand DNA-binding protein